MPRIVEGILRTSVDSLKRVSNAEIRRISWRHHAIDPNSLLGVLGPHISNHDT